ARAFALMVVEVAGRRVGGEADVDPGVARRHRLGVAGADDLERLPEQPESGEREDLVGVERTAMGGDLHRLDGRTRPVTAPGIYITELDAAVPAGAPSLAVKDLFDTAGVRTTYGSAVFADHVPDATAEAVTRLERAGYASVGKANLHEFAWGITSENPHYGWVPNPIAEGRIAGGSSGGCAAALAAGLADAALGTDSAGSIRIPAACCGVTGFKPTHGLVQIEGCFPLARSFDHAGPMARDVAGCARMMDALAPDVEPVTLDSLADLRVAVAWTGRADPLVR